MMISANVEIPVRDYSSSMEPPKGMEAKIVKLSGATFRGAHKSFRKSGNFTVVEKAEVPAVKAVSFNELSPKEKSDIEKKVSHMEKIISFEEAQKRVLAGDKKVAKLGESFVLKLNANSGYCRHMMENKKVESVAVPTPAEVKTDVTINFDPEEIKQRVNDSFENAESNNERVEFTPIKEYTIDIPEEEEEVESIRLPHAERSAKLDMSSLENEDKVISLQDYINKSNIEEKLEKKKSPSVDQMIRNAYAENGNDDEFSYENVTQEDIRTAVYYNDGVENDTQSIKEQKRRQAEDAAALEVARQQKAEALENYKMLEAQKRQKEEEEKRIQAERKKVETQKEEAMKLYETTLEATKKQLEAERMKIVNETKKLQKEYQSETEEANRIWTKTVETETTISEIDARIPSIMQQIEDDREEIDSIMNRTQQIREMAKDITGSDIRVYDNNNVTKFRTVDHNFDSIFDGVSPIDSSSRNSKSGYSKGKKAA